MSLLFLVVRLSALAALALAPVAVATAPASAATGDVYVHAGQNFKPVSIAVTPFAGDDGAEKIGGVVGNDFARSIFLLPVNPSSFPEAVANPDERPNVDAWKGNQRAVRADRAGAQARRRACHRAVPAVGRRDRRAGGGRAVHLRSRERPARRAHDCRLGVLPHHRREGLLRFARRVRRRERPEGEAPQAARGDGHGRRQREVSRQRRHARRHAALLALGAAGRLHVVRRGRPQGDAPQSRDRPARGGRQFSRHDVCAALLARRAGDRDVADRRREHQPLHDGPALACDDAAHRHVRHRHVALVLVRTDRRSCSNPTGAERSRST